MIKLLLLLIFSLTSNFSYSQNIMGIYNSIEPKCRLNLKIGNDNSFIFSMGKIKKNKGIVTISKEDKIMYLDFSEGISAMFSNDTISIQNSGNSMNPYVHFKECNDMYIHLVKEEKFDNSRNKILDNKKYLIKCSKKNLE
ncbi:hypothetical protein LF887_06120 [Chryseobacterium sp. MEBOG06]|uniref:hypothetical protein n=1 Tax=unclassified Chryseobacterium TaxID=2593645 RepID=UPI001F484F19|nr:MULTISPECIES: hypothetical protein [unclassified Chryseobacterium]UKB85199.1 hypothetical protein LF887_06120 [Chryseobacterium sp. MEBOG06]